MQRYNIFRYVLQYFEYFCIKTRKKRHSLPQTMLIPTASMTISSQSGSISLMPGRHMIINPPEEWKTPTSTPISTPTSSAQDLLQTDNSLIRNLVKVIGNSQCSIKDMLEDLGLRDRKNFLEYHLNPAIAEGYVRLLYPDKPRHPRQKYLLTLKGLAFLNELKK